VKVNIVFKGLCLGLVLMPLMASALSLSRGSISKRDKGPASLSGITYAGGDLYYVIADNGDDIGLYPMTVMLASDGRSVSSYSISLDERVVLEGVTDIEGVAYDPGSGNVWIADEGASSIAEYSTAGGSPIRQVDMPAVMERIASNCGLESLTISGDGLTMWTANEEALVCDGSRSSYSSPTTVRLVKFTRSRVDADWQLAAMYAYTTDKWHHQYGYGTAGRRGVSDLCALPDGSLLVIERELSSSDGSGLGVDLFASFYRVSPAAFAAATDIQSFDEGLSSRSDWSAVSKELMYDQTPSYGEYWLNYEGLCLGPRLSSGNTEILSVTDGGDGTTYKRIVPFVLSGLSVRTLSFTKPAYGSSSVAGSLFRYLDGSQVTVELSGTADSKPYAVDGTELAVCNGWSSTAGSPSSGTGSTASFAVVGDGTFAWNVSQVVADKGYHVADSFEGIAAGTPADLIDGWSGEDCLVEAVSYVPPTPPGYVMTKETHAMVLSAEEGVASREIGDSATATEKMDVMVCVCRCSKPGLVTPGDDVQTTVAADENGRLCLWHLSEEGGVWEKGWTPLSDKTYAEGTWVRLCVEFDYESNPNGDAFVRVKVDGSCCPTARGVRAPNDLRPYGAWHYLAKNRRTGGVSKLTTISFLGSKVDDLMLCKRDVAPEHTGATSVDGIAFAWFDDNGFPRDPTAAAPFIPGYNLGNVYDAGVDPYGDKPLEVTDFNLDADGSVNVEFNGYRGENPVSYRLFKSDTPDFKTSTIAEGTFEGDSGARTTTWSGKPSASSAAGFYKVEALR